MDEPNPREHVLLVQAHPLGGGGRRPVSALGYSVVVDQHIHMARCLEGLLDELVGTRVGRDIAVNGLGIESRFAKARHDFVGLPLLEPMNQNPAAFPAQHLGDARTRSSPAPRYQGDLSTKPQVHTRSSLPTRGAVPGRAPPTSSRNGSGPQEIRGPLGCPVGPLRLSRIR